MVTKKSDDNKMVLLSDQVVLGDTSMITIS